MTSFSNNISQTYHSLVLLHYCGGGAYGEVYYGRDISGRELAVKIVSKQKLGDAWQRELKGVINYRKITEDAPELLQIYHVEEDEDTFFYTMEAADSTGVSEYVPDTLAARLKNGPLPQTAVFDILSGIFSGIKTIHDAGFAHRDIKPDNILFVKGVPKLGDIGLMSSLESTFTQIAGTMDFLPPELRIADGSDSTDRMSRKRNDLYAFGKVIYCAVTGLDPHSWPAVPKELPLSLPLKFFLRLSFQLCDKDPAKRLDSIADLQKEFSEIKRKLIYGETLRDKLVYHAKRMGTILRSAMIHTGAFLRKYWIAVGLVCVLIGGAVWYFWPEQPYDITKETTQIYHNDACGFTLTLPKQWEILKNKMLQQKIDEIDLEKHKELSSIEAKRAEFYKQLLKLGADFIYCDYDEKFPDNIAIQNVPVPGNMFMEMSDEDMRVGMRQMYQGELGYNTEIYELKRMEVNGHPCIMVDLSHEPGKTRILNYLFMLPDKCFSVAVTAKTETFEKRREVFNQIIQTIKFDK